MADYVKGYKYRLEGTVITTVPMGVLGTAPEVHTRFITLRRGKTYGAPSVLVIRDGYAWNGSSGPTPDTQKVMRPSLVHDALYQLLRDGYIPRYNRDLCDVIFRDMYVANGAWQWHADLYLLALRKLGERAATTQLERHALI